MAVGNGRQLHMQQTHYIRKLVNFNDTGIAAGVRFGTLPAAALVLRVYAKIQTLFNAATTNVLVVGTTAAGTDILTSATAAAGTAGLKSGVAGTDTGVGLVTAAETDLYVTYTQTGTAATTGQAYIVLEYTVNNDQ